MRLMKDLALLSVLLCGGIVAAAAPSNESASNEVVLGDPSLTSGIPGVGLLTDDELTRWLDDPANHVPLR